jgi:hypothetical protein
MAEPNPVWALLDAIPFVAVAPPAPRKIEDVLVECGFSAQQADLAVDQGLKTCLSIALMTPAQIDKLYELNRPPAVSIIQEVRLSSRHKVLVFRQWLLEAYDLHMDLATVDLNDLTIEEMDSTQRVMASKIENKRLAPGKKSDLKEPSVYTGTDRDWHNWNTELQSYLGVLTRADGMPMHYVIRNETRRQEMIALGGIFAISFEVPIEGKTLFDHDNHAVHLILKQHTVRGTDENYVTQYKGNRRGAYLGLSTLIPNYIEIYI